MSNPRELKTLVDAIAYIVVLRREIKKLRRMNTRLVKAKGHTQPPYQVFVAADATTVFRRAGSFAFEVWVYLTKNFPAYRTQRSTRFDTSNQSPP